MTDETNALRAALFDAAIDRSLESTAVLPHFRKPVRCLLREQRRVELVGGNVLMDGLDVDSAVRAWIASDAGRPFLGAAREGAGNVPPSASLKRSEMNASQKGAYIAKHGLAAYQVLPA